MIKRLWARLMAHRIINFMLVGGLGFLVSMAIYYPLTLFFQNSVSWLGQEFYLPATIPATLVSITFNYYMNRRWTFGDCPAKRFSLLRYEAVGMSTAMFDILLLFVFVHFLGIFYMIAAVMAVICMFLMRYFIVNKWVWKVAGRVKKETFDVVPKKVLG